MRKLLFLLPLLILNPVKGNAAINIFACEPEWASVAKEIGGDDVSVFIATKGTQDPHHISAKPSLLAGIRKADMIACTGGGLEDGWLPVLMQGGGSSVQAGQPGYFLAGDFVALQGKPVAVDRAMGDVHPEGNPHIQTDPRNILTVARAMTRNLSELDPAKASQYQSRLQAFETDWGQYIAAWKTSTSSLKGAPFISYHDNWLYLANWLGMKQVTTLEVKPGIPPTASHLDQVLKSAQANNVKIILLTPFDDDQAAKWLADKTGAKIIRLPFTVGGLSGTDTLKSLFDKTIGLLKS